MNETKKISLFRSGWMALAITFLVALFISADWYYYYRTRENLDGARRLLERANDVISEQGGQADPKSVEALAEARALIGRSEDALAAGRPREARDLVATARETLRACLRTEAADLTRERVMERIARVEALRGETRNLAAPCPAPGIRELMGRADEHLRLAREHADASRLDSAQAEARIAGNLYQRISDICAR